MKPTGQIKTMLDFLNEVAMEEGYTGWYQVYSYHTPDFVDLNDIPQKACKRYAQQAISQMQPEWVAWDKVKADDDLIKKFNTSDSDFIMLAFDDGSVRRFNEDHPTAEITQVLFLPQPPTK